MIFSSDSKALVITSGKSANESYEVFVIKLQNDEAFLEANFKI